MTAVTPHIPVFTFQRKRAASVVIEDRWLPFGGVVAARAIFIGLSKLSRMHIGMTCLAHCGCRMEIDIGQPGLEIWGLMAGGTLDRTMRSQQGKPGRGMIKLRKIRPCSAAVARLAACFSANSRVSYARLELSMVRILMAGGA